MPLVLPEKQRQFARWIERRWVDADRPRIEGRGRFDQRDRQNVSLDPSKVLASIPAGLRDPLLETYGEIVSNFAEHRWEPSELNGGKFCEVVYTILEGAISSTFAAGPSKPANMKDACLALEKKQPTGKPGDRSLRILLPRALLPLYEIRNNRGVGHVGGDVDPNLMDATAVYSTASWVMGELIRVFHHVSTVEAQGAVDALSERKLSLIWSPGTVKRVLDHKMNAADQTLVLLHQGLAWVDEAVLLASVEYSSAGMYRKRVLNKLHKARMIEFDKASARARISPTGSAYVEEKIIAPRMGWKSWGYGFLADRPLSSRRQTVLSQPSCTGNPSPESSVTVS
jgi:hypothetical protein